MDDLRTRAFGDRLQELVTGGALTMMIAIGHRTGLLEAAAGGWATSVELAERAGLDERYVREWVGAMVTGGILEFAGDQVLLPPEHAELLTGARASNVAPAAASLVALGTTLPQVQQCFTAGGGVPIAEYVGGAEFGQTLRHVYDEKLVDGFLDLAPGLIDRLRAGASVLDVGCGTGHAINVMAGAFPHSRFVGLDNSPDAIRLAEAERAALDLPNARFAVGDAAELAGGPYDLVTAFDAVHDQQRPEAVLGAIRAVLAPGGTFFMVDTDFASGLADNVGNPYAPSAYAISLLFCVPTSRAAGGSGLGAVWGRELATELLAAAGFTDVVIRKSPRPQNCVYVCTTAPSPPR